MPSFQEKAGQLLLIFQLVGDQQNFRILLCQPQKWSVEMFSLISEQIVAKQLYRVLTVIH